MKGVVKNPKLDSQLKFLSVGVIFDAINMGIEKNVKQTVALHSLYVVYSGIWRIFSPKYLLHIFIIPVNFDHNQKTKHIGFHSTT